MSQWPGAMVARAVTSKRTVAQGRTHQNHPSWLTVQHSQGHAWRGRAKDSAYAKGPRVPQASRLAEHRCAAFVGSASSWDSKLSAEARSRWDELGVVMRRLRSDPPVPLNAS